MKKTNSTERRHSAFRLPHQNKGLAHRVLHGAAMVILLHGMVAAAQAAHLYYSEFNGQRIGRANLDGTGKITLSSGFPNPVGPTLDLVHGHLYWGEAGGANIWRANLDGSERRVLIGGRNGPGGPALDLANGRLYWNDSSGGMILSAKLDGSDQQILARGLLDPHSVTLDLERDKIYWPDFGAGAIWRANLDGSAAAVVVPSLVGPALIALDSTGGKIYWTAHGTSDIRRANLDGSNQEILVRNQNLPAGIALDLKHGHLYWTTYGGNEIRRANVDGSDQQVILSGLSGPGFVSLDLLSDGPPAIQFSPRNQIAVVGEEARFAAGAAGAKPLYYQWLHNGAPLPDQTSATLVLSNLTFQNAGTYQVIASNALGWAESAPASLNVQPLLIASQTGSTNAWLGSNVTFQVAIRSPLPPTCQWRRNEAPINGATNLTLTFTNIQILHEGDYSAVLENSLGSVTSQVARLSVLVRPAILQPPLSQSIVVVGDVTFSVEVTGNPPPFTYQWRRGSSILTNLTTESRVAYFTLTNVQANEGGLYRVVVANPAAPSINGTSPNASWTLTVLTDTDNDGLPDTWESAHGLDPNVSNLGQDSDEDGVLDGEEYVAGTNPQDATSHLRIERVEVNSEATIQFQAASNKTYTVLQSDRAGAGTWSVLTDVVARATNRVERITDSQGAPWRFYRLVTPRRN